MAEKVPKCGYEALVGEDVDVETAVGSRPAHPVFSQTRSWHRHWCCWFGDCDRIGAESCLLAWFCPCIAFGLNREKLLSQSALMWGVLFFIGMSGLFYSGGVASLVGFIMVVVIGATTRHTIRKKYGLEGNPVTDCLLWTFCHACALSQETRTLEYNCVRDGIWHGPAQVLTPAPTVYQLPYPGGQSVDQVQGDLPMVPVVPVAAPMQQGKPNYPFSTTV